MAQQRDFWFRPKRYGYGAEPANWKGWLATLGFIAVVFSATWVMMVAPALQDVAPTTEQVAIWFSVMVALVAVFIWFCRLKSDGDWRWRWGGKD